MIDYTDKEFRNRILSAIRSKKLIIFVGAGISKLCGLPLWYDLGVNLLNFCVENKEYNFSSKDKELLLSSITDSRELVTIAKNIIDKKDKDTFYTQLSKMLTLDEKSLGNIEKSNYETLPKILKSLANTIITTNADEIIDKQFDGKSAILYTEEDINKFDVKGEKQVFHIHGSIKKPDDMVFSTAQYLRRYNLNNFSRKMINIFNNPDPDSVILIIGYSLSELQLLDFVIKNEDLPKEERLKKTFLLNGYYSYQENVFEAEKDYYETYGITLLSYSKDENGFQGLVEAVKEINDMANNISAKDSNQTRKVLHLFNSKPNKISFDEFLNEFSEFDNTRRDFSLNKLKESIWMNRWVKMMFDNKKCFDKYFDIDKNLPSILFDEYSFSCCRFLTRIKVSGLINKAEVKRYFKKLLLSFIQNEQYFESRSLAISICNAIMTNPEYISMPEAYEFIKKFDNREYRDYWILYLCHQNDILLRVSKSVLVKYSSLLLQSFYLKGDKEYYFNLFCKTYSLRLCNEARSEIIDVCEKIIDRELKEKEKFFTARDTFEELAINKDDYYPINKIYKIYLLCLGSINENEACNYYAKYKKKNAVFYKQLSIYLSSIKYNQLESALFEDLANYIFDRKYFAEIYSCFKRNNTNISSERISDVLHFIQEIKFKDYSEIWNLTAKKYMLELFSANASFIQNQDYLLLCGSIENSIDEGGYRDSIKTMPSPNNMSKSVWSSVSSWSRDKTLFNEMKDLSDDDLFVKLKTIDYENYDSIVNVRDLLELRVPKGFVEYLKSNNLLGEIPNRLANILISVFYANDSDPEQSLENILAIVNSRTNNDELEELKRNSFDTIYYIINKLDRNERNSSLFRLLFDYTFDFNFENSSDWELQNTEPNSNVNVLFTAKVFYWLLVLLLTCSTKDWDKLKRRYSVWLNDDEKKVAAKASLCSNLHILWKLDSKYVKENIAFLFDNIYKGINYSHISYQLCLFYPVDFINLLHEQGLLVSLISDDHVELNWNIAYLIIYHYFYSKINKEVVESYLNCNCLKHALFSIAKDFEKRDIKDIPENVLSDFFEMISKVKYADSDHCAVAFYKLSSKLHKVNNYIGALTALFSSKNSAHFAKELLSELSDSKLSQLENERVLSVYLENLEDHYFYVDEIVNLINAISWSSKEAKQEIINKLSKSNPIFLTKFD